MRQATAPSLLLALAALASPALAQGTATPPPADAKPPAADSAAEPPSFSTGVEQVIVDVVVTDKKGTPIKGLTKDALTIQEDGVPQQVVSFEAIELPDEPPPPAPAVPPRVSVNTDPGEQKGRTFAIVFDDTHLTPMRANQAKAAVASFLEKGVRDGDRVSLVSTAGGIWWTTRMPQGRDKLLDLLKRLDGRYIPDYGNDRMSDNEALRIHVYHDTQVAQRVLRRWEQYGVQSVLSSQSSSGSSTDSMTAGTVDDPFLTGRASEVYYQAATRLRTTLDTLERVINGLAAARGRKSVILVSEGFIYDINLDEFKRVNEASRRANAAIYFVNARGLEGLPVEMTAQFGPALPDQDVGAAFTDQLDAVAGSEQVSSDSGGFTVRNSNDLAGGVQRIANETRAYYLLGYVSTNTARDGKFRKIQVKLADRRGLQVRARKGYYAPNDTGKSAFAAKKGVDPVIQAALDSPWAMDGIPLRMTEYVGEERMLGKAVVLISTEIDVKAVDFEEKDGRELADLEFLLVVAHRESGEFFRYDQGINMKLLPATRDRLSKLWYPLTRDFELKSGDYQAKMVVRDKRSGRVGTVVHEFVVPPLGQFRVSTPIISDSTQPATPGGSGAPRLLVIARRQFASDSDVYCQIEVFGAKADAKTGQPIVRQGYEVRRADGSVFTSIAPSVIRPTSLGAVNRFFAFKLADAPPGKYELFMTLRDDVAGVSTEVREPFEVVAAGSLLSSRRRLPPAPPGRRPRPRAGRRRSRSDPASALLRGRRGRLRGLRGSGGGRGRRHGRRGGLRRGRRGRGRDLVEDAARARAHDRQGQARHHEEAGENRGRAREDRGRATGAEGRLRAAAAERAREVLPLALLEQHDRDQEQAGDDVEGQDQVVKDGHGRRRSSILRKFPRPAQLRPDESRSLADGPTACQPTPGPSPPGLRWPRCPPSASSFSCSRPRPRTGRPVPRLTRRRPPPPFVPRPSRATPLPSTVSVSPSWRSGRRETARRCAGSGPPPGRATPTPRRGSPRCTPRAGACARTRRKRCASASPRPTRAAPPASCSSPTPTPRAGRWRATPTGR
jgi:VWFA-related protein